jgi:hypothetical protein
MSIPFKDTWNVLKWKNVTLVTRTKYMQMNSNIAYSMQKKTIKGKDNITNKNKMVFKLTCVTIKKV